jgi:hypothetical protein
MINKYLAMGLGALIAIAPVAALAQADTTMAKPAHTGSHKSHMRHKASMSKHHARSSAHHMHKKKTAPAEAPKS